MNLVFDGTEGGLIDTNGLGTGFTMIDPHSGTRLDQDLPIMNIDVNGYEPSKLSLANTNLVMTASKGIAYVDNNAQVNSLGVGLQNIASLLTIETKLLSVSTGGSSAQAGIWFGIDDENFVKLDVNGDNVEMRREIGGVSVNGATSPDQIQINGVGVADNDVTLRLIVDPIESTITAYYAINNGSFVQLTKTNFDNLVLPQVYLNGKQLNEENGFASFAGIYNTYRNGASFDAEFDYFSVSEDNNAPVIVAQSFDISDDSAIGTTVGIVAASDLENNTLSYSILSGNDSNTFFINENTGEITTLAALDFATSNQYILSVQVNDDTDQAEADVTINVTETGIPTASFAYIENFETYGTGNLEAISGGAWVRENGNGTDIPLVNEGLSPGTSNSLNINGLNTVMDFQTLIDNPVDLIDKVPFYFGTYFNISDLGTANQSRFRVAIRVDDAIAGDQWIRQIIGRYDNAFNARFGLGDPNSNDGQTGISADKVLQFVVKGVWDKDTNTITYAYTIAPTLNEEDNTWLPAISSHIVSGVPSLGRIFINSTNLQNDGKIGPVRLSTDYAQVVTEEINETELSCSPLSTLDCDQIEQSIPLVFDFSSDNGNLSQSGFSMVLVPSARLQVDDVLATDNNVPGYAPSLISQGIDGLTIASTKGLFYSQLPSQGTPNSANTNSQMNALGVGVDVPGAIFNISTSLLIPDFSLSAGNSSQQSGIWYGLDENHIIKLVVLKTADATRKIQLQVENMDNTTAATAYLEINTGNIPSNPGDELSLRLVIDPLSNSVSAYYAINGATEILVSDVGGSSLAVPVNYFIGTSYDPADSNALLGFAGIFTSHRNAAENQSFNTIFKQFEITAEPELPQLSFDVSSLNFSGVEGSLITPKTVTLSANTGNPVVILSPDPDASWLVLPSNPILGSLEIGIAANLPIGTYSTTLYVIDQPDAGYINGEILISLEITEESNDYAVNVNFSDAATAPPAGYIRDSGLGYGDKGNGLIYGWLNTNGTTPLDLTRNGRIRNYAVNDDDDLRAFTLMHMQYGDVGGANGVSEEGIWEIEVPNGQYNVTVGVGDPDVDSAGTTPSHTINVEGTSVVSNYVPTGVAGASTRFTSGFATVLVSDGKLTVDADGGFNTKINSIRIVSTTGGSKIPRVISSTPTNGSINVSTGVNMSANNLFLPNFDGIGNSGVDNTTITETTVKLIKNGSSTPLASGVNGTGGGDAINLDPDQPLEPNTTYTFIIDGVLDNTGVAFEYYESTFTTGTSGGGGPTTDLDNVSFTNSGTVANGAKYSTLTIGPDNKLYGLVIDGDIHRWTIETDGTLSNKETLNDWKIVGGYVNRTAVGLVFDPSATASNLIAYITHDSGGLNGAPAWDGNLSRLTGSNLENHDLILVHLPRSKKDHLTNSMAFKPGEPRVIYFNQGSNSAAGAPDNAWGNRKERLLSGANLRLDLDKLPAKVDGQTYLLDVKTTMDPAAINAVNLNSPTLTSTVGTYIEDGQTFIDDGTYNPFYINAPLTLFATGIRNAYDLVWHSNGQLYIPTNGTAGGSNAPASIDGTRRPDGTFYDHSNPSLFPVIQASNGNNVQKDWLFRIDPNTDLGFYGHPNPLLGQFVLNRGDADVNNGVYNGVQADINYRGAAFDFELNKSPNGVIEYKSNAENGNLKGAILVVRYSGGSDIIALVPDGPNGDILTAKTGIPGFSGFVDPLDLVEDVANGNIYVSDYARNEIVLLKPSNQAVPTPLIVLNTEDIIGDAISNSSDYNEEIIISNLGNAVLSGVTAEITGANSNQFSFTGLPSSVNTQSSGSFNVIFTPTSNGPKYAELTISGTGADAVVIALTGLGKAGNGGANEPSLQWVLDTQLGNGVINVGDTNPATNLLDLPNGTTYNNLLGDEISAQKFERATDAPVTLELLSVYGPTTSNPVVAFGYYESGNAVNTNELFTISNSPTSNGQTLNAPVTGSTEFDPGLGTFGFYSRWPAFNNRQLYSEDVLNTFSGTIPHHVRVYELPGESNAYIIATEEHVSGFDYQDVVVIARNIRPFGGLPKIATDPNELVFEITTNGQSPTTETKSVVVSNTGTEVLNISSVAIEGAFADQFNEVQPSGIASIEVGESLTYTVTYAPDINGNNLGFQDATLMIQSDDSTNPSFSIGLFGLKKSGFEGGSEPPLQDIVDALGIGINVGWTNLSNGTNPNPVGDEVEVERWVKVSDAPVNIIPVGRYSPAETIPFGWYTNDGSIVTNEVGILDGTLPQAQTLYPAIDTGTNVFDPSGAVFGIYVQSNVFNRTNYTEDAINTEVAHRTRIYPNKDRAGNLIENSYLIAFEDASNGDYQDYMFVIDNVIPYEDGILALNFDKDNLDFVATINQVDIQAQQLSISRTGGVSSQEITLTSSEEWVVLPNSFDINSPFDIDVDVSNLSRGSYEATVTATAVNYEEASVIIILNITNELVYTYQFNFQDPDDLEASPIGYIDDIGLSYGIQNTGLGDLTYGWVLPGTSTPADAGANARNRNTGLNDDALAKTFTIIGHNSQAQYPTLDWLVNVPNGTYSVNISVAGDPDYTDSNHVIDVNGVTVVDYNEDVIAQVDYQPFESTSLVEVTDGILRLGLNPNGVNAKVSYIRLAPVDTSILPPTIVASFEGNSSAPNTYRGSVEVSLSATDESNSGGITSIEYSLDGNTIVNYTTPIIVVGEGVHTLLVTAVDNNANNSDKTYEFIIEPASGALLAIENMTKVPGTDRGFPANDYYTFHRLGSPGAALVHDSNVMRLNNSGTGELIVDEVIVSDSNDYSFELFDAAGIQIAGPNFSIPVGGYVDVDITFIGGTSTTNNGIFVENIEIISNADNAIENMATLHGAYSPQPEGGDEINAQQVFDAFGFQTSMLSFVNDDGNIVPSPTTNPSSNYPNPENIDAGYEGDMILSSNFVQADPTKPVIGIQLSALHGGPGSNGAKFIGTNNGNVVGGINFSHDSNWYQTLLPKKGDNINFDTATLIDTPFRIDVSGQNTSGRTNPTGQELLGLRLYKVIDQNGIIIPNEYIAVMDFIANGCGAGSANCDWNDNTFYFINIRPEGEPTSLPIENLFVNVGEEFSLDISESFDSGYPGNILTYSVSNPQGNLPSWVSIDAQSGILSGTPDIDAPVSVEVAVSAIDLNGLQTTSSLNVLINLPPIAQDDEVTLFQNVETLLDELLANDSEPNDQAFTITSVDNPLNGQAEIQEDGLAVLYTPNLDYVGVDSFMYIIEDESGLTATATVSLTIASENQAPVAVLESTIDSGQAALFVEFTGANSSDENPGSLNYNWNFGDGLGTATEINPSYTFTSAGQYTVVLTVTDAEGLFDSATKTITVSAPQNTAPIASATITPVTGVNSLEFIFDASASSDLEGSIDYLWNFGDGTTSTEEIVNHTYDTPGFFTVELTVTDSESLTNSVSSQIEAKEPVTGDFALRINAGGPALVYQGDDYVADQYSVGGKTYTNGSAEVPQLYRTERSASPPTFGYNIPLANGDYEITLHFAEIYWGATGGSTLGGANRRVFDVVIEGATVLDDFDINATVGAQTVTTRTFPVSITDGVLNMNLDAQGSDGVNEPKLSAIEIIGNSANELPVAVAIANITSGTAPLLVEFNGSASSDTEGSLTYLWDFKDGVTSNEVNPVHTFTTAGIYNVSLLVTDEDDQIAESIIAITVEEPIVNNFALRINAGGPALVYQGEDYVADQYSVGGKTYTNGSAEVPQLYRTERSASPPTFGYIIPLANGDYEITLHFAEIYWGATGGSTLGGANRRVFDVVIEGATVLDDFDINATVGAQTVTTRTFPVSITDGVLNMNLDAQGSDGVNEPKLSAIEIIGNSANELPVAVAIANITSGTAPLLVEFNGSASSDTEGSLTYLWDFKDGVTSNEVNPVHTFTTAGIYNVSLLVTDEDDQIAESIIAITVEEPIVNNFALRINAGGPALVYQGEDYVADQYSVGGKTYTNGSAEVPQLYRTERSASPPTFGYIIPLANGDYEITLHFAEIYWGATGGSSGGIGARVFDVLIEGETVLDDFDIIAEVGPQTVTTRTFPVTITDGVLNMAFDALGDDGINQPKLSAIEILGNEEVDNTVPIITLNGANPQEIQLGEGYTELGATTEDGSPIVIDDTEFIDALGTYTIYYDANDGINDAAQVTRSVEVVSVPTSLSVTSVVLYNGDNNQALFELTDGMVLNVNDLPTLNLNIQVFVTSDVGSVLLELSGAKTGSQLENNAPLGLFGNTGGSLFTAGSYNFKATPYSLRNRSGTVGTVKNIGFELVTAPVDVDGDGFLSDVDCDDLDPNVYPGAPEVCDGKDNDCDGSIDEDLPTTVSCPTTLSVTSVVMYNGDNDQALFELTDGMVLNVNDLPTLNLNIQVFVTSDVGSVLLELSGAKTGSQLENNAPLGLSGNTGGSLFTAGSYSFKATPYSLRNRGGTAGSIRTIGFEIMDTPALAAKSINVLSLYPNPASVETTLSFDQPTTVGTIQVFDVTGRLVRTIKGGLIDKRGTPVNVQEMPAGTYFVKTTDASGLEFQQQMLIQR
ncbi:malectin domain-containing carbohydrate-binding protein [uncultured Maribacter sp.]|uniref:malectin domain-containing carbohydrate-binding protein n=1 Tax=uncultured Maribacter sp. TaxID=431308 RepID=UPI0030EBEA29